MGPPFGESRGPTLGAPGSGSGRPKIQGEDRVMFGGQGLGGLTRSGAFGQQENFDALHSCFGLTEGT